MFPPSSQIHPNVLIAPQDIMRPARDFDEDEEMQSMGGYKDPEEGLQAIAAKATPMPKW